MLDKDLRPLDELTQSVCGNRKMWAAVLESAIVDYCREEEKLSARAHKWLFNTDYDKSSKPPVTSFVWVCFVLDLDPKHLRRAIEKKIAGGHRFTGYDFGNNLGPQDKAAKSAA